MRITQFPNNWEVAAVVYIEAKKLRLFYYSTITFKKSAYILYESAKLTKISR